MNTMPYDTREGLSFMNCFAAGATKVPLHRRETHKNSIWAHLNSASMVTGERTWLHISLDPSHILDCQLNTPHPIRTQVFFLMIAVKLEGKHMNVELIN